MYPQIKLRTQLIIPLLKQNNQFIKKIITNFNQIYHRLGNLHSKKYISPTRVVNIFSNIVREWSEEYQSQREYIRIVIQLIKRYCSKKSKILIYGSAFGRMMFDINKTFENIQIQGHQSRSEHFICCEYLLSEINKTILVYPFINNFTNHFKTNGPYRGFQIPSPIPNFPLKLPITFGNFQKIYSIKTQSKKWEIIITNLISEYIQNVFQLIQCIYSNLSDEGYWIDVNYGTFDNHLIQITFQQFEKILDKSQFEKIDKICSRQKILQNIDMLIYQQKMIYYTIYKKKNN